MPEIKEPNKKASNELVNIPKSEVREPINPARLPKSNPNLLVFDCIKDEIEKRSNFTDFLKNFSGLE